MTREFYEKLNKNVRDKGYDSIFRIINNSVTLATFVFYPALLIFLLFTDYEDILKMIIVPLSAVIILSIARHFINAPRPYEVMDIKPLNLHRNKGKSFPSRHVFSIFMIAFCCLHINIFLGIILLLAALILAFLRVICGAHFIRDVIAGTVFALISYIIGFICF